MLEAAQTQSLREHTLGFKKPQAYQGVVQVLQRLASLPRVLFLAPTWPRVYVLVVVAILYSTAL